jgi:hypothetical protein
MGKRESERKDLLGGEDMWRRTVVVCTETVG